MATTRQLSHYSDFLAGWATLVGIPPDRVTTELAQCASTAFQTAIQKMWIAAPWLETSPYGEARFLGNRLVYPNNLSQTEYWKFDGTGSISDLGLTFSNPIGVAFDSTGNLYVACQGDGTVAKVTPALVQTVFASGLDTPTMLAFDSTGNLYVSNYNNGVINKITSSGTVTTFATGFSNPYGLAFDGSNNLYIANSGDGTISKVTPSIVTTTFATGLSDPYGLTFDADGLLYAANYNGGTVDRMDTLGNVTPLGLTFSNPVGLDFDIAGNLYIACSGDGTIAKVTPALVQSVFATGLDDPYGLTVTATGQVYVANYNALIVNFATPNGGLAMTSNSIANPADGEVTATKAMETATLGVHSAYQAVASFFPATSYTVSFYARPNGRAWQKLVVNDGASTYSAFFNTATGQVGTNSGFTSTMMGQQPNGFWLCQATFTASNSATGSGGYQLYLSSNGTSIYYQGSVSKGAYFWGALVQQTSNTPVQDLLLPWAQVGESEINAVFNIWPCSPFANNYPSQFGYNLTPQGIQVINGTPYQYVVYQNGVAQNNLYGAPPNNPIYVYYRKTCPKFTGDVYDATATYDRDEQAYFTNSLGSGDFYKCIVSATTAGESPESAPTKWELIPLYLTFLQYVTYQAFGDWLISDGQFDKAQSMYVVAESKMGDQFDLCERQMDCLSPLQVTTHLSSRPAY